MGKGLIGTGLTIAAIGALTSASVPAYASQVPCGNPADVQVHLQLAKICFTSIGANQFNKIGVKLLVAGKYGGVVKVPGKPDRAFAPGDRVDFRPPVNPTFINLNYVSR